MQTENVLDFHEGDDGEEYENEIVVAKLVTGESIIGEINIDLENYDLMSTVQFFLPAIVFLSMDEDTEKFIYRVDPWIPFSEKAVFNIKSNHIVHIEKANEQLIDVYASYIEYVQEKLMFGFEEENEPESETEDEDNTKKILH
jgi:hypothetical protein